jgi:hypothetical protein
MILYLKKRKEGIKKNNKYIYKIDSIGIIT